MIWVRFAVTVFVPVRVNVQVVLVAQPAAPLHPEMRVREYLKFRARLKGLSCVRSRERVDVVIDQCGLTDVSRKIIGQLSKGYRQRVGLADALVHEDGKQIAKHHVAGDGHQAEEPDVVDRDEPAIIGPKAPVLRQTDEIVGGEELRTGERP